jgi:hypothetical protein
MYDYSEEIARLQGCSCRPEQIQFRLNMNSRDLITSYGDCMVNFWLSGWCQNVKLVPPGHAQPVINPPLT